MKAQSRRFSFVVRGGLFGAVLFLLAGSAHAQLTGAVDNDLAQKSGSDSECAMAKNPTNPLQLFAFCNTSSAGMLAVRSTDGGVTWIYPDPTDKTIADGDPGQGPSACCDPTLAWDTFGNLYITYINAAATTIETILSTDGGATFTNLATFSGSVDQPTVVAANTTAPGAPVAVWIVWNQGGAMVARGAAVTGLGAASVGAFTPLQTASGTGGCSFGDIAISPAGVVVQVCGPSGGQTGGNIVVNVDADGLGPGGFGPPITATTTLVGGFDFIPAQNTRSIDTESGLVFDANPASPHFGRLYLMYTDESAQENNDTDIMLRFSDNNGTTWSSPPIRVNDDPGLPTIRSQFNPKISIDDPVGNFMVCWHDCRESATNTAMREYCTAAGTSGASPTFLPNVAVGDGLSTSNNDGFDFGDFSGMDYSSGGGHPIWGDTSNSTGNNPNGTGNFDAQTDRVTGTVPVELMSFKVE
jgi:hypothetical protein